MYNEFLPFAEWCDIILKSKLETYKNNKGELYLDVPSSFDIETSSYYNTVNLEKRATMYIAMIGINESYTYVRTYNELVNLFDFLKNEFAQYKIIIYVHNLSYEFQFIRKWLNVTKIFASDERKPFYFESDNLIFKCSYLLSGLSLENVGIMVNMPKQVGKLNYEKIRHSKTPLTTNELLYCLYDLKVIDKYILQEKENYNHIANIPLTKTGKVRKYIKNICFYGNKKSHRNTGYQFNKYRDKMKNLSLTPEAYILLKNAFAGGFTHSNPFNTYKKMYNVYSYDETSAYPGVMFRYEYPMSKPIFYKPKNLKDFHNTLKKYCCVFEIEITNLKSIFPFEFPLSFSKTEITGKYTQSNGRIVDAEKVITTLTEQDYFIFKKFYKWDKIRVRNMYIFKKAYLPIEFINAMLDLYQQKTELKGVEGKEDFYLNAKEKLNSFFGMCVTDIAQDECLYINNEWSKTKADLNECIKKYNSDKMRFLFYAWGVWVTAYNRRVIFSAIYELKEDYVYSDTDSVKFINLEKHKKFFDDYNEMIIKENKRICKMFNIDIEKTQPKTIKGEIKYLGVWEYEGKYQIFKTCGAKRYMYLKDYKLSFTVSGCNKKKAIPYLINMYGKYKAFDYFSDDLYIPCDYTSKMTHTYIDDGFTEELTDYLGNTIEVTEKSYIHLEKCDFNMSMSIEFLKFIQKLKVVENNE